MTGLYVDGVDFVVAPIPEELLAAVVDPWPYTGSGRPASSWYDRCRQLGRWPRMMIQEMYSNRSQEPGAGVHDVAFAEYRANEEDTDPRYPIETLLVVVSDGNSADSWDCGPYARDWNGGARRTYLPYGSVGCCASFLDGVRGQPLSIDGEMIPATWGSARTIVQTVGGQAPLSTPHDLDLVLAPYWKEDDVLQPDEREALLRIDGALKQLNFGENGGADGSMQQQTGLMATVLGVPNGAGNLTPLITQIAHLLSGGAGAVDVEACVAAAKNAWETSTNATEWANIEAAIRGSLAAAG